MSADILEYVDQKVRDSASSSTEWSILYADDWAKLRAEIVRLRGEVEFHRLDAGALRVQLDSCIDRLEVQTKNALHLHAMMVDAEARAEQAIAPAEAKGDACNCPGGAKPDPASHAPNCPVRTLPCRTLVNPFDTPQPADGGAVAMTWQCWSMIVDALRVLANSIEKQTGRPSYVCREAIERITSLTGTHPPAAQVQGEALTNTFVQAVPDKCDRIIWRNRYYHLPINHPSACELGADPLESFIDAMGAAHGYRPQAFATGVLVNSRDADRYEGWLLAIQHRGDSRGGEGRS